MATPRSPLIVIALLATGAWANPSVPRPIGPSDGGWCARACELSWTFSPLTPETVAAELELYTEQGALVLTHVDALLTPPGDEWTTPALPDAGFFTWRVRGIDDAGAVSTWSNDFTFVVDGVAPPMSAAATAELDGGFLHITTGPIVDLESGRDIYHYAVSRLDQLDGSVVFNGSYTSSSTTRDFFLGPATYLAAVHAHDRVGNIGPNFLLGPLVVLASPSLPAAAMPEPVRGDAGAWPFFPYVNDDSVRFRVDAGGAPVTSWAFSSKAPTAADWEMVGFGPGPVQLVTLPVGLQDVRVALISDTEVSPWSAPVRLHVDQNVPLSLTLTASVDGGLVELRWPLGRDTSTGASGVREYAVARTSPDASVVFPRVPHPATGPVVFSDVPGFGRWTWAVRSIDFAGNFGPIANAVTELPPALPVGLAATPMVTRLPVELTWAEDRDGGFVQVWSVRRFDTLDASVVASALSTPALSDDAPEGTWSYEVFALVDGVAGVPARLDGVVRDVTPPVVSAPQVTRLGTRTAQVDWAATDALAGLDRVELERETTSLGTQRAPITDTPPGDGSFRYRVVATDLAGNVATSEWSPPFIVPGPGLVVEALEPLAVQCGARIEKTLVATEFATWSLRDAPETSSVTDGVFSWAPQASDVGVHVFTVRADGTAGFDERAWRIEVACERLRPGVGCGCQSVDVTLLMLGALLARRRRR